MIVEKRRFIFEVVTPQEHEMMYLLLYIHIHNEVCQHATTIVRPAYNAVL